MDYETAGWVMGMGDRLRNERAHAQALINHVAAERDHFLDVARHNLAELNKANAVILEQRTCIARLEAKLSRQSGRA